MEILAITPNLGVNTGEADPLANRAPFISLTVVSVLGNQHCGAVVPSKQDREENLNPGSFQMKQIPTILSHSLYLFFNSFL